CALMPFFLLSTSTLPPLSILFPYTTLFRSVQKGVPVIHPAQPADGPGPVQHRLGQGGLARVHVGHHPHHQTFCHILHGPPPYRRSEEHTSELQSRFDLVCRLLLEKKKII